LKSKSFHWLATKLESSTVGFKIKATHCSPIKLYSTMLKIQLKKLNSVSLWSQFSFVNFDHFK